MARIRFGSAGSQISPVDPRVGLQPPTTKSRLLILDEPTKGIQPSIIKEIERVIMSRGQIVKQGARADMERDSLRAAISL